MNPDPTSRNHRPSFSTHRSPDPSSLAGGLAFAGRPSGFWFVLLFALAAGARVGWVTFRFADGDRSVSLSYPDEEAYVHVARSLAGGGGLVDDLGFRATYMPVYPAFIALFTALPRPLLWARIAQALLGALAAPGAALLAWQWMEGSGFRVRGSGCKPQTASLLARSAYPGAADRVAVLAGVFVALDPFLVFFSGLLLTETLFTAALVITWVFVFRLVEGDGSGRVLRALPVGLTLWLCVMLRPSAMILVILVPFAVLVCDGLTRRAFSAAGVIVVVVLLGLVPWAARNASVLGEWRWLTTRGGISLYDGLRAGATGESDLGDTKGSPEVTGLDELAWDAHWRAEAWEGVRNDPRRVLGLAWVKLRRTWSLTPNVEAYRGGPAAVVSAVWMTATLALAVVGGWRHRRAVRAWVLLLLPVAAFTLLHMIFVGSVRYRVPVMPMVAVLSAAGAVTFLSRFKRGAGGVEA